MNYEKYMKEFNDLLLNDKIDDDFKSIVYGLVHTINKNPEKSIDMAYIIRNAFNSYNLSKTNKTKEEKYNIEFKEVDWSCFFYGADAGSSYFGSYIPTEVKNYGFLNTFGKNFNQIYTSTDGKIHLKFQPKFLTQKFDKITRNANLWHYIELVLTKEEIRRLKLTEDDNLVSKNKKNLLEEILKEINNYKSKVTNMDKVLIPLEKELKVDEFDLEFIKILIEFIQVEKKESSKAILNILDKGESLNVSDLIYMYNVFMQAGYCNIALNSYEMETYDYEYVKPTPITVKTPKCKRINWMCEDSWIKQIDDIDYLNAIMINSSNLFLDNKYTINLDIEKSFATSKNINELIDFIEERGIYSYTSRLNALKQKIKVRNK